MTHAKLFHFDRSRPFAGAFTLLLISCWVCSTYANECSDNDPVVTLITDAGTLTIELFPDAAPEAVTAFRSWAQDSTTPEQGGLVGRAFDYTHSRIELRASSVGGETLQLANEIDAVALGLHKQRIANLGAAINTVQRRLLPAYRRHLAGGPALTATLETWLERWFDTHDAKHLVGQTTQSINEALGHRYRRGLTSRSVTRGAVMLVPHAANVASGGLSIALADMPQRTGTWMVIGEVIDGLDVAERIAIAPLTTPRHIKPRLYEPLNPVAIRTASSVCAATLGTDDLPGESL